VSSGKKDRPYFKNWLKRTSKQFAVSGRLTWTAMVLAKEENGTVEDWRSRLRLLMEGNETPSLNILMRIDAILANPSEHKPDNQEQRTLFE
jgi:hypothetical protein